MSLGEIILRLSLNYEFMTPFTRLICNFSLQLCSVVKNL